MATSPSMTALRQYRRERGLCNYCGGPGVVGVTRCQACSDRDKANRRRSGARDEAASVCTQSGCSKPVEAGYKCCPACIQRGKVSSSSRKVVRKHKVLDAYGGPVCVGCGEREIAILQIDHIDGGGTEHAREIGDGDVIRGRFKMYQWLIDNNFPPGFRVLCPSCNIRAYRKLPFPNQVLLLDDDLILAACSG